MLSKSPKAIRPNAQGLMNHAKTSDMAASTSPNARALEGDILPDGIGLPFVLSMIASISRSLYPVRVSTAAEPAATPPIRRIHVIGLMGMHKRKDAVRAAPNLVKKGRYQILGLVS